MKVPLPLEEALVASGRVLQELRDTNRFAHVEYAGSIRRGKEVVGDVEIVASARPSEVFMLDATIREALERSRVSRSPPDANGRASPWGPRYYRGVLHSELHPEVDTQLDLFVVLPPAEWGPIFLIRTGNADFSQAVVTRLHRYGLRSKGGRVVSDDGRTQPCPDELTLLNYAHLPWIPPAERTFENEKTRALFA